jgi:hypothetical protein
MLEFVALHVILTRPMFGSAHTRAADRPSCRHREQSQGAQAGPEPEIAILGHQR